MLRLRSLRSWILTRTQAIGLFSIPLRIEMAKLPRLAIPKTEYFNGLLELNDLQNQKIRSILNMF